LKNCQNFVDKVKIKRYIQKNIERSENFMSKEDKSAVLQAMKKMKKANKNIDDIDQEQGSGNKSVKNDADEGIADSIINAVRNFAKRD